MELEKHGQVWNDDLVWTDGVPSYDVWWLCSGVDGFVYVRTRLYLCLVIVCQCLYICNSVSTCMCINDWCIGWWVGGEHQARFHINKLCAGVWVRVSYGWKLYVTNVMTNTMTNCVTYIVTNDVTKMWLTRWQFRHTVQHCKSFWRSMRHISEGYGNRMLRDINMMRAGDQLPVQSVLKTQRLRHCWSATESNSVSKFISPFPRWRWYDFYVCFKRQDASSFLVPGMTRWSWDATNSPVMMILCRN